jgi:hypothetical protein
VVGLGALGCMNNEDYEKTK